MGGGGVRMRSSKLFQKLTPPEFLIAWELNALEERRRADSSSRETSSGETPVLSVGPAITGARLGEEQEVVGCECDGWRVTSPSASLSRT